MSAELDAERVARVSLGSGQRRLLVRRLDIMKWAQIAQNRRGIPGYPETAY